MYLSFRRKYYSAAGIRGNSPVAGGTAAKNGPAPSITAFWDSGARRRVPRVDIHPDAKAGAQRRLDPPVGIDLVFVRVPKLVRGDLECGSVHRVRVEPRELDDRVMGLAARLDHLWVVDLNEGLPEAGQLVRRTLERPPESGQLNGLELERAVGKQYFGWGGHCGSLYCSKLA